MSAVATPAETLEKLGLVDGKQVWYLDNDAQKVPSAFRKLSDDGRTFIITFDSDPTTPVNVHPSRVAYDASLLYIKPKTVKEATEPKAKQAPMKIACQFSIDDFVTAFPDAILYYKPGSKFDHPGFTVLAHVAIFDDNTKVNFNSYNGIINSKLDVEEYNKLCAGEWTKPKSVKAIDDVDELIKRLSETYTEFKGNMAELLAQLNKE